MRHAWPPLLASQVNLLGLSCKADNVLFLSARMGRDHAHPNPAWSWFKSNLGGFGLILLNYARGLSRWLGHSSPAYSKGLLPPIQ